MRLVRACVGPAVLGVMSLLWLCSTYKLPLPITAGSSTLPYPTMAIEARPAVNTVFFAFFYVDNNINHLFMLR